MTLIFFDIEHKAVLNLANFKIIAPTGSDYLLSCEASISVDCFSGKDDCSFLKSHIIELGDNLKKVIKNRITNFEFKDLDKRMIVRFETKKSGNVFLFFELTSKEYSSKITFDKEVDVNCLEKILEEISCIDSYLN